MLRKIIGIRKTFTIKGNPFTKNPLPHRKKPLRKGNETNQSLSETYQGTSGVIRAMKIIDEHKRQKNEKTDPYAGKKIRPIRGVVVSARKETLDTWTLEIFVGDQKIDYKAGQFISISPHQFLELRPFIQFFEHLKGKAEPIRAYSLKSAPHEKNVSITIKPESFSPGPNSYPPLLSPFLASDFLVGREIEFIGYAGAYTMPEKLSDNINHVVHLVAGSGIVPSFSIINDELFNNKNSHARHTLIYVNKSYKDIIFHDEIVSLRKKFPNRLVVRNFLSREDSNGSYGPEYIYGRPNLEQIKVLVKEPKKSLFFACGPAITKWQKHRAAELGQEPEPRFMEWVINTLDVLNVDKKFFKREVYG